MEKKQITIKSKWNDRPQLKRQGYRVAHRNEEYTKHKQSRDEYKDFTSQQKQ